MRYFILAGVIAGAILGYYVLWSHLIDRVAAEAENWIAAQRSEGRTVSYDSIRLWGFPYRLSLTVRNLQWHDPQSPAGWRLGSDELTAHLQLWKLDHVIFVPSGQQRIGWHEAGGSIERQAALAAERIRASLVLDGAGNWDRFAADIAGAKLSGALQDWSADKLLLHARRAGNVPPSADLSVQAENLLLPPSADGPLGRGITSLKLIGSFSGSAYGKTPEAMLSTWRDSGGTVEFGTISLHWGGFALDGDGTLTLDRQFRPLGAMTGRIRGVGAGIDALVAAGQMKPNEAAAAKAAAGMLSQRGDDGQAFLQVPLTAQEGRLFLGPVALFSLPSVLPVSRP